MAGLYRITKEVRPHCPHCHELLDLREFVEVLFETILESISDGESRIYIKGFGTFSTRYVRSRSVMSFGGVPTEVEDRLEIRFKAAQHAKDKIQEGIENARIKTRTAGDESKGSDDRERVVEPKRDERRRRVAPRRRARPAESNR